MRAAAFCILIWLMFPTYTHGGVCMPYTPGPHACNGGLIHA